jgi:hypothetical protein
VAAAAARLFAACSTSFSRSGVMSAPSGGTTPAGRSSSLAWRTYWMYARCNAHRCARQTTSRRHAHRHTDTATRHDIVSLRLELSIPIAAATCNAASATHTSKATHARSQSRTLRTRAVGRAPPPAQVLHTRRDGEHATPRHTAAQHHTTQASFKPLSLDQGAWRRRVVGAATNDGRVSRGDGPTSEVHAKLEPLD